MCGIFALLWSNKDTLSCRELVNQVIGGLRRLEYRGYDSAGFAFTTDMKDGTSRVVRSVGNIDALCQTAFESEARIPETMLDAPFDNVSPCIIGHTRWATHGPPCERNAHPQVSPKSEFIVVHNGILTNFHELRSVLGEKHGYEFSSDTDTELIALLAHHCFHDEKIVTPKTLGGLLAYVMPLLEGASAIVLISPSHYPNEIAAVRRGSPLIVGLMPTSNDIPTSFGQTLRLTKPSSELGLRGVCISSDPIALRAQTKHVIYLEDDEGFHFSPKQGLSFYGSERLSWSVQELELELEVASKGMYPHFMLKEIWQQPEAVEAAMRGHLDRNGTIRFGGLFGTVERRMVFRSARRFIFVGCGTSYYACATVRPLFREMIGRPVDLENASDLIDQSPPMDRGDVVFFVSQSGETADVITAMDYCEIRGAFIVGITNVVGSTISRRTVCGVHLNCGPEIGVASTKAYTAQVTVLVQVALALAEDSVPLQPRRVEIIKAMFALPEQLRNVLTSCGETVQRLAPILAEQQSRHLLLLGRGYQHAAALEAALKFKEVPYIAAEGILAGELKHGPLALMNEHAIAITLGSPPETPAATRTIIAVQQLGARGVRPWVLLPTDDASSITDATKEYADEVIPIPVTVDCLQPLLNIVPLQLLAYHTAVLCGCNVDCPRNIAKSVTVE